MKNIIRIIAILAICFVSAAAASANVRIVQTSVPVSGAPVNYATPIVAPAPAPAIVTAMPAAAAPVAAAAPGEQMVPVVVGYGYYWSGVTSVTPVNVGQTLLATSSIYPSYTIIR
jgi:hypothetical protein